MSNRTSSKKINTTMLLALQIYKTLATNMAMTKSTKWLYRCYLDFCDTIYVLVAELV